jgi:hypothetical protein
MTPVRCLAELTEPAYHVVPPALWNAFMSTRTARFLTFAVGLAIWPGGCGRGGSIGEGSATFTANGTAYEVKHLQLLVGSGGATIDQLFARSVVKMPSGPAKYSFHLSQPKDVLEWRVKHMFDAAKPADFYPSLSMHWYATASQPFDYLSNTRIDTTRTDGLETFNMQVDTSETKLVTYGAPRVPDPDAATNPGNFWLQVEKLDGDTAMGSFGGVLFRDSRSPAVEVTNGAFTVPVVKLYRY